MWENTLNYLKKFLRQHFPASMEVCCVSLWLGIYKLKKISVYYHCFWASQVAQTVKNMPAYSGDLGSIPMLARSSGEGYSNPLHYSCLENSMDRGAWWATELQSMESHGVEHSRATNIHTHIIVFSHVMFYNR